MKVSGLLLLFCFFFATLSLAGHIKGFKRDTVETYSEDGIFKAELPKKKLGNPQTLEVQKKLGNGLWVVKQKGQNFIVDPEDLELSEDMLLISESTRATGKRRDTKQAAALGIGEE